VILGAIAGAADLHDHIIPPSVPAALGRPGNPLRRERSPERCLDALCYDTLVRSPNELGYLVRWAGADHEEWEQEMVLSATAGELRRRAGIGLWTG
jgi:hypothetical protein